MKNIAYVKTDDATTLKRMARAGYILELDLVFSWRFFRWMYRIKTYGL